MLLAIATTSFWFYALLLLIRVCLGIGSLYFSYLYFIVSLLDMFIGFMSYLGSIVVFTVYSLLLHGLLSICWLSTMSSSSTLVSTRFYATDLLPLRYVDHLDDYLQCHICIGSFLSFANISLSLSRFRFSSRYLYSSTSFWFSTLSSILSIY